MLGTDLGRARYLLYAFIVSAAIAFAWLGKQSYSVYKLTRGVGDTWFYTAEGRRWFRLDDQRHDVPIAQIAPDLQHAFVAVEDHRFFLHPGVDPIALARAVFLNVRESGRVQGGSTLTQQLARTLFLSNRKSYGRKAREAVLAFLIEAQLGKQQILELYLNRIFLGAGTYGVEAMSQRVFGKPASALTLAESALIAGLARAPAALSPWSNLDEARARSHVVLARMRDEKFITEPHYQAAMVATLRVRPYRSDSDSKHGYAKAYLRQRFRDEFGGDHPPDWRVETTFVAELQDAAEAAVENGLRKMGKPSLQAALVAIDPATGNILALVGGRDYQKSAFNRASRSRRQPGSAFKPFVFAAALERGMSPVSTLTGLNQIAPQGPDEWTPRDVHDDAPDELTLRAALIESNNRAATLLQQQIGSGRVLRVASRAGLDDLPDVPSLALGSGLVTPLAITAAFSVFPNGGYVFGRAILRACAMRTAARRSRRTLRPIVSSVRKWPTRWCRCCAMRSIAAPARPRGNSACAFRSAARPGPPTNSRTRGSSASPRRSWQASGSASINRRRLAPRPTARATPCRSGQTSCSAPRASARRRSLSVRPDYRTKSCVQSVTASPSTAVPSIRSISRTATTSPIACARFIAAPFASVSRVQCKA